MTDEEKRTRMREYRRARRAAGLDTMGNGSRDDLAKGATMVLSPWAVDANGIQSRELRGI